MAGAGCARPRLLQLGDSYAPLLMSGGRMKNNGTDDNDLWISWRGAKYPAVPPLWEHYSVSYWHNVLSPANVPKFTAAVNSTTGARETSAYTALVPVGRCSAVLLYGLQTAAATAAGEVRRSGKLGTAKGGLGFAMRIEIHLDEGGEAGVHC
jgi:hypothetical protein